MALLPARGSVRQLADYDGYPGPANSWTLAWRPEGWYNEYLLDPPIRRIDYVSSSSSEQGARRGGKHHEWGE